MIFESKYSDNILEYLDKVKILNNKHNTVNSSNNYDINNKKYNIKDNIFFMKLNNSIKECYTYIDS